MLYDAIQIGPFTIQYFLVVVLFTFITTYYLIDGLVKESVVKQFIIKNYWTVFIILFFSYKFSILLFRPDLLLSNKWLFFTVGRKGIYLGVVLTIVYLVWESKKEQITKRVLFISISLLTLSLFILFQLIKLVVLSLL